MESSEYFKHMYVGHAEGQELSPLWQITEFIHFVACLARGPWPLPKRVLRRLRCSAASFSFRYRLVWIWNENWERQTLRLLQLNIMWMECQFSKSDIQNASVLICVFWWRVSLEMDRLCKVYVCFPAWRLVDCSWYCMPNYRVSHLRNLVQSLPWEPQISVTGLFISTSYIALYTSQIMLYVEVISIHHPITTYLVKIRFDVLPSSSG